MEKIISINKYQEKVDVNIDNGKINFPNSENDINDLQANGNVNLAIDAHIENNHYLRYEWTKKELDKINKELAHPETLIQRSNFLIKVKTVLDNLKRDNIKLSNSDFDKIMYILMWYIDSTHDRFIRFELSPKGELYAVKYIHSNQIDLMLLLLELLRITRKKDICIGDVMSMLNGL